MERGTDRSQGCIISLFVIVFLMGIGYVAWLSASAPKAEVPETAVATDAPTEVEPTRTRRPTRTPRPTKTPETPPTPTATPAPPKVGVVAGHWQSDAGAVCPDGLQEATINLDVASRVVAVLQTEGYDAELLAEFSPALEGYRAAAFVSVHADSCEYPGLSGFKVARVAGSAIPDQEDRLVRCLVKEYGQATGLEFHTNTVTYDMVGYHAFHEIDPQTPGAIIELGFMDADRELLTEHSYELARAVARGIACFLEGE